MLEDFRQLRENLIKLDADTIWMCLIVAESCFVVFLLATGQI